jgi:hypothetical protein
MLGGLEMNFNKVLLLHVFIFIQILTGCSSIGNTASNEMDGIELELVINKQELSSDDEIVVTVILTNHNKSMKEILVPTPEGTEEGISAVMVERKNQSQWQLLNPHNNKDISNVKERSFYDFVPVEIGANETIEQEFRWDKELLNQESGEIVEADSGEYILSAFIILDELNKQEEYYEPEKQLISKLNFIVK